ncbi:MAG TPA: hypothetical protein VIF62_21065 [Labilithrix sp.]|jgi:ketosteroid isomerase-like protein
MKKWMVIAGCAVVALVAIGLTIFRASDEDRIREVMTRLAKAVSVKQDDNMLTRNGRIKSTMKEICIDMINVDIAELPELRITNRADFADKATQLGAVYVPATVEFTQTVIKVDPNGDNAKVDTVAVLTGMRGGEQRTDKRDVHMLLHKDGSWLITTIDVLPPRQE